MRRYLPTEILCVAGLMAVLAACGGGTPTASPPAKESVQLRAAQDCNDLEQRIKAELTKRYQRQESRYLYGGMVTAPPVAGETTATTPGQDAPSWSTTNLQEQGVDEGDLVKTDGAFIYLARGSRFLVLKARPAAASAIISDIDLQETISELYLADGRVSLITASYGGTASAPPVAAIGQIMPAGPAVTRLYLYNVTNPARPAITAQYTFPGSLQGSRRIGAKMYVVTNYRLDLPAPVYHWDYLQGGVPDRNVYANAVAEAQAENLRRIAALALADMIPLYSEILYSGAAAGVTRTAAAAGCGDIYYPESGNGTDLSFIFTLDTAPAIPAVASSAVFSSWCRIYMSPDALYLSSGNDWAWITPLATAGQVPLNPEPSTALHKFTISGASARPAYRGSGAVPGWLNDQFSMGEYNGYLRIGTTRGGWWGEGTSNRLTILAEHGGELAETGAIEGIAPGERIYSLRFDRDRGYMVTFRQTDPLFTFDLSNPSLPKVAGDIHVNGFATYIHLLGANNNRLLTIGRSADSAGRVTGNKLQLFDVTNLALPVLVGDFELGSGWSAALYDHHAFLYYEPLSLLAIPYSGYSSAGSPSSTGLRLFAINPAGISSRGILPAQSIATPYGSYADSVDRAVIINNDIYSIAQRSVTVAALDTLLIAATVDLPASYLYYPMTTAPGDNQLFTGNKRI